MTERFLRSDLIVRLTPDVTRRRPPEWSTVELRAVEDRLLAPPRRACRDRGRTRSTPSLVDGAIADRSRSGSVTTRSTRCAVLCDDGVRVRALVAPAGFGKTTVLHAAAAASEAAGRRVVALAPTHKAVARAARRSASTRRPSPGSVCRLDTEPLGEGTTVIVDEVSQVGTRDAAAIVEAVAVDHRVRRCGSSATLAKREPSRRAVSPSNSNVVPPPALSRPRAWTRTAANRTRPNATRSAKFRAGDIAASQTIRRAHGWEHQHSHPGGHPPGARRSRRRRRRPSRRRARRGPCGEPRRLRRPRRSHPRHPRRARRAARPDPLRAGLAHRHTRLRGRRPRARPREPRTRPRTARCATAPPAPSLHVTARGLEVLFDDGAPGPARRCVRCRLPSRRHPERLACVGAHRRRRPRRHLAPGAPARHPRPRPLHRLRRPKPRAAPDPHLEHPTRRRPSVAPARRYPCARRSRARCDAPRRPQGPRRRRRPVALRPATPRRTRRALSPSSLPGLPTFAATSTRPMHASPARPKNRNGPFRGSTIGKTNAHGSAHSPGCAETDEPTSPTTIKPSTPRTAGSRAPNTHSTLRARP